MSGRAGQVVLVTGAARGIGRALAERFAGEGARVVLSDRDAAPLAESADAVGGSAFVCDVGDAEAVAALVGRIAREFGRIDLVCSNAGILRRDPDWANAASASDEDWAESWRINVLGHVHVARAVLPAMIARGAGTILNTVSAAGLLAQIGSATYTTTKHAALGFTEYLAITHRDHGIRVHALCPQGVATRMAADAGAHEPALRDGLLGPEQVAEAASRGLDEGRFLILPHAEVASYVRHKAENHDRWIGGMARLRRAAAPSEGGSGA